MAPTLQPKRRWGWAHLALGVAILIFVGAVALLVHKLIKRSRGRDVALVADGGLAKSGDAGVVENVSKGKGDQGKGKGKGDQGKGDQGKGDQGKGDQGKGDQGKGDQGKGDQGKGKHDGPKRPRGPIRIVSRPRATLYVNGRKIGKTPRTLRRRRRPRVIAVVKSKYELRVEKLDASSPSTVSFDLKRVRYPRYTGRKRAHLIVRCRDRRRDRRRVLLNGKDTGFSCPTVGFYIRPGRWKVGLRSLRTGKVTTKKVYLRRRRRRTLRFSKERTKRRRRRRRRRRR